MPRVQFATISNRNSSEPRLTSERLINYVPEIAPENSRAPLVLRQIPGSVDVFNNPALVIRACLVLRNRVWLVASGKLYELVFPGMTLTDRGNIDDDALTFMSAIQDTIQIVANNKYYLFNTTTNALTNPTSGAFSNFGGVTSMDGYAILWQDGSDNVQWSEPNTPQTLPALNFRRANSKNDAILRCFNVSSILYVLGEESIEAWQNTRQAGANAFDRIADAVDDRGVLSASLAVVSLSKLFFVGNDRAVYRMDGAEPIRISSPAVEADLVAGTPTSMTTFAFPGHRIISVNFSDRPSWCFDTIYQTWFERSSGVSHSPWNPIDVFFRSNEHYAVFANGRVARIDQSAATDSGTPISRVAVSIPYLADGEFLVVDSLEVLCTTGRSDLGRDAQMQLEYSKDGGETWVAKDWASIGTLFQYNNRVIWKSFGASRLFSFRVTCTEPSVINMYSTAYMEVS